jgi:hypothetical protein
MISFLKWVSGFSKKLFIILAVYITIIAAFMYLMTPNKVAPTQANYNKATLGPVYEAFNDPANNKTKQQKATNDLVKFVVCRAMGEMCSPTQVPGSDQYFAKSALGGVTNYLSMSYTNPPASGIYWAQEGMQKIGLAPKTYAAEGIGLAGIKPFAKIWTMFRNISYLLLTLLVVTIGLMIMFRVKINPQTVVTLESALPRIVVTIVLITFSFAISGFAIDLMYAVILGAVSIFSGIDPRHFNAGELNSNYVTAGMSTLWEGFFPSLDPVNGNIISSARNPLGQFVGLADLGSSLINVLPSIIGDSIRILGAGALTWVGINVGLRNDGVLAPITKLLDNAAIFGNTAGSIPQPVIYYTLLTLIMAILIPFTLTFGGGWILAILIWFTLILLFFRIMIMLFTAYLRVILYVIFAPFLILTTAIPGRNGFTQWLRSLLGELSVFPTVIILLLVGRMIVMAFTLNAGTVFNPGNFGDSTDTVWTPPFLWGINQRSLAIIIGMQLIFLIPQLSGLVRQRISGSKGSVMGGGAGVFFAGLTGGIAGGMGGLGRFQMLSYASNVIPGLNKTGVGRWLSSKAPSHPPHGGGGGGH